jgi:DNA-binding LytR/AlgR family response regulator
MSEKTKILIVEDEMVIGANISLELNKLGYEVTGIVPRGEEALVHLKENTPDILLLDINLKGELDGVETAKEMQKTHNVPIIYLTANTDDANFNRAKETHPYAFITKPFKKLDLKRAIELTLSQLQSSSDDEPEIKSETEEAFVLNDSIFVRQSNSMLKILIEDILYIEAQRNYCKIFTKQKEHLLVITLKEMDEKLPSRHFLRVHRSFIINIAQVSEIVTTHLIIGKKTIPLNKTMKDELLKRLQTI